MFRWKYSLIFVIDANFKLKRKNRDTKDISLTPGWAYFVNPDIYNVHIANYQDEPEVRSPVYSG